MLLPSEVRSKFMCEVGAVGSHGADDYPLSHIYSHYASVARTKVDINDLESIEDVIKCLALLIVAVKDERMRGYTRYLKGLRESMRFYKNMRKRLVG